MKKRRSTFNKDKDKDRHSSPNLPFNSEEVETVGSDCSYHCIMDHLAFLSASHNGPPKRAFEGARKHNIAFQSKLSYVIGAHSVQ